MTESEWRHFAAFIIMCIAALIFAGCKTQQIPQTIVKDSIRTEYRLDSIRVYERDSIYVDRYRANDTVWLTTERWSTRWRDKIVEVHDTTTVTEQQTIVEKEPYIPDFYKWCTALFFLLLLWRIGVNALKIYRKIQSGGLL